jgi:hypothetical protein
MTIAEIASVTLSSICSIETDISRKERMSGFNDERRARRERKAAPFMIARIK